MKRHILTLLSLIVICASCKKDKATLDITSDAKYILKSVESNSPVDLNYDGTSNRNLMEEIPVLRDLGIFLTLDKEKTENHYINILWVEPRVDDEVLFSHLPEIYSPDLSIEYLPVDNQYYFDIEESTKSLKIGSRIVAIQSNHTLEQPQSLEVNSRNQTIVFRGRQKFLTISGISTISFTAIYQKDTSYIAP
ncbi:hypothetical protein [Pedobacter sp. GR22-6]|uniref:hypothetical protein n=1 Tax=Pedobacter sp. GR22-6 TaxID=3127957 RepID=UPI00307D8E71